MRPRLGFLGVGWIGRDRMLALHRSGVADVVAVSDPDGRAAARAARETGAAVVAPGALYDGCLALDGVVVATPSALHAAPTLEALDGGLAVFCQKPLGRDAGECAAMVDAARAADRLLGVDLSYRHAAAFDAARGLVAAGAVGHVYLAELEFHNAY
ncbi:MAG: oxidoreductase domain protein, partial [Acidimicrobiales bacterium]|nr:oxidoreductase domain protein [Acidimicrobiales bacterium]